MKYTEFRDSIAKDLKSHPSGKTWKEIKNSLSLPYKQPCPEWICRLEQEIHLERKEKKGNALIWRLSDV
tara:strand:- start:545 stop:751 length:207 start_codon:yes stop_codon:yes gene_type:complete